MTCQTVQFPGPHAALFPVNVPGQWIICHCRHGTLIREIGASQLMTGVTGLHSYQHAFCETQSSNQYLDVELN